MKGAKVRVELTTIYTADVDAFATLPQRCCQRPLSLWHNRGHQTTPFPKESVTRLKATGKIFPKNIQKQIKEDFHCLEVHIKIMTIKKGSRHSLSQPNKSNLPFFPK